MGEISEDAVQMGSSGNYMHTKLQKLIMGDTQTAW
jgi:hypothetical protein